MLSEFESFDREFGGMLSEQFAACDTPIYHPSSGDPFPLAGAIVGKIETTEVVDEDGGISKPETRLIEIPAEVMRQNHINRIELAAKIEVDETMWAVADSGHRIRPNWFDITVSRKPLHRMKPKKNTSQR